MELVWCTFYVDSMRHGVCVCTKGCRKVYEKKTNSWSAVMDHLANAHGIPKDAKHPSILSKQAADARHVRKQRALDAGMTEARFQAICTTRYIIRRLLPFSHVECKATRPTDLEASQTKPQARRFTKVSARMLCLYEQRCATDAGDAGEQVGEHDLDVHECSAQLE